MKKFSLVLLVIFFTGIVLSGCAGKGQEKDNQDTVSDNKDGNTGKYGNTGIEENKSFMALVLETDTALLIAPDMDTDEYKSSDKISVNTIDADIYDVDGKKISIDKIKAGDRVEIGYNGLIMESYPAQISCYSIRQVEETPLMEAYMALLHNIYEEDSGLNDGITLIAFDTTQLNNLTEAEKARLLARLHVEYGLEIKEGTFDELAEEGLIDKENLSFETGILIKITDPVYKEKSKTLTCGYEKWRSGIGAIGAKKVTVKYKDGAWDISKDGSWIS